MQISDTCLQAEYNWYKNCSNSSLVVFVLHQQRLLQSLRCYNGSDKDLI